MTSHLLLIVPIALVACGTSAPAQAPGDGAGEPAPASLEPACKVSMQKSTCGDEQPCSCTIGRSARGPDGSLVGVELMVVNPEMGPEADRYLAMPRARAMVAGPVFIMAGDELVALELGVFHDGGMTLGLRADVTTRSVRDFAAHNARVTQTSSERYYCAAHDEERLTCVVLPTASDVAIDAIEPAGPPPPARVPDGSIGYVRESWRLAVELDEVDGRVAITSPTPDVLPPGIARLIGAHDLWLLTDDWGPAEP